MIIDVVFIEVQKVLPPSIAHGSENFQVLVLYILCTIPVNIVEKLSGQHLHTPGGSGFTLMRIFQPLHISESLLPNKPNPSVKGGGYSA